VVDEEKIRVRHAFTGYIYERVALGEVRVFDPETDAEGVFGADGEWRSGSIRNADFHLIRHVGGLHSESDSFPGR
jgi:hypothetical protein